MENSLFSATFVRRKNFTVVKPYFWRPFLAVENKLILLLKRENLDLISMRQVTKSSKITFMCSCNGSSEAFESLKNSTSSGGGSSVSRLNSDYITSIISSILLVLVRSFPSSFVATTVYFLT
jgi:hypothetical protein